MERRRRCALRVLVLLFLSFVGLGLVPHFTIGSTIVFFTLFALLALTSAGLLLLFWLVSQLKPLSARDVEG